MFTRKLLSYAVAVLLAVSFGLTDATAVVRTDKAPAQSSEASNLVCSKDFKFGESSCSGNAKWNGQNVYVKCTKDAKYGTAEMEMNERIRKKEHEWNYREFVGKHNIQRPVYVDKIDDAWCFLYPRINTTPLEKYLSSLTWKEMIAYGPKVLHQTIEGLSYLNRAGIEHYGLYSNSIMITYKTKSPEPTVIIGDYGMTRLFPNTVPGAVGKRQTYQVGSAFYSELAYGLIENNPNIKRNSIEACFANIKAAVCGRPVKPPLRKPVSELLKFWQQIYPETKNVFSRQKIKPFLRDVFRLIPDDTNLGLTPDQFLARSDKPLPAQYAMYMFF